MRMFAPLSVLVLATAGCLGGSTGSLAVFMSDEPNDIGDFSALVVEVERVVVRLKASDGANETEEDGGNSRTFTPDEREFDLTELVGPNETRLLDARLDVGTYQRMDIYISSALGTLRDGTNVTVDVPSGRVFLNKAFEIAEDQETEFVFDVTVVKRGDGSYALKPNATESGTKGKDAGAAADAGKGKGEGKP